MEISEILASATRRLQKPITLQGPQGQPLDLPAGKVRLEIAWVEDLTGGYNSVKVYAENEEKNWSLLADFHFAFGGEADKLYDEILAAIN